MKSKMMRSWALGLVAAGLLGSAGVSNASITLMFTESGSDVVVMASGSFDFDDLSIQGTWSSAANIVPKFARVFTGAAGSGGTIYKGIVGPSAFGSGDLTNASSGSGDPFGFIFADGNAYLPSGYVSGAPLSGSSTYVGKSLSSLGLTTGTYNYTWGSGANADSLKVQVGAIPEPSASLLCLYSLTIGLLVRRRKA